jgi:serine/threonine-protein kinase
MAPEQARGDQDAVDARADVHALGAILHFLLTSQGERSRTVPRWAGAVPRPLQAICKKAMAPEPRDRYPSVTALSEDVSRFLAGARVLAHAENWLEKAQRFASKYRTPILLVLAYLLMRLVGLLIRRG